MTETNGSFDPHDTAPPCWYWRVRAARKDVFEVAQKMADMTRKPQKIVRTFDTPTPVVEGIVQPRPIPGPPQEYR